jgi:hypothetical protein
LTLDNAPRNLDRNLRFLGILDSAKTAHPVQSANQINNWWMPENVETHLLHCAAAEAITIKQVLWGEIPQLPRNQSFDSPAWLNLADYFIKSKLPLFSICVLGKSNTPQAFVEDCAQQFKPTSPFALSGWPGLEEGERQIIADNINRNGNFKAMFGELKFDSSWQSVFEYQRDVLQRLLEYLESHYKSNPLLIRAVDQAQKPMWQRIEENYKKPEYIAKLKDKHGEDLASGFSSVFQEIKAKADRDFGENVASKNRWLSGRTNLYREIYRQPKELRELLRAEIDRRYVETTGESVTGVGRFGDADRSDSERDITDRDYDSLVEDSGNDPDGLKERYIIDFERLESQRQLNEDFLKLINDVKVASRIQDLRKIRNWPNMPADYILEKEEEHLDALCQDLPDAVIRNQQKYKFIWKTGKFTVNVLIGIGLGSLLGPLGAGVGGVVFPLMEQVVEQAVATVADETALSATAQEKTLQLLAKRRKVALTGLLRDWLTKPIVMKE